jgi:hypothetical protein
MPSRELETIAASEVECCPPLARRPVCDVLDFRYRLPWRRGDLRVDIILHYRLERCSGPMALGDLAYSTTLFPGETVRLFTSDRHTRWSYDSQTSLAYRHETTSEESFFTWGMARSMSDLDVSESGSVSKKYEEDWSSGGGGLSVDIGIVEIGGGGGGGSFDAESTTQFARNLSQHAESSSSYVASAVRAKSTTSVGEVETRNHAEGESESHLESSSRSFSNPNRCHAVTYFFYKIVKQQKIRFRLVGIQRVVADPAAPTAPGLTVAPDLTGRVAVRPQSLLATSANRLDVERIAREAAVERAQASLASRGVLGAASLHSLLVARQPIALDVRQAALGAVDADLAKAGMLDAKGNVSDKLVAQLSWEREEWLPTPGLLVKGCLDHCSTCEPSLQRQIALELERRELENKLLARRVELLEKAQEYRCCPVGEEEPAENGE